MLTAKGLPGLVHSLGQTSIAITDHGLMGATYRIDRSFREYNEKNGTNLKFIPGQEFYFVPDRTDKKVRGNNHLVLLAKTNEGFRNLVRLSSLAYLEGFYYKPRIDWELLERYKEGLICLTACVEGPIAKPFNMGLPDEGWYNAKRLLSLFGSDLYIEVMYCGLDIQSKVLPFLLQVGRELEIPVVATNDVHYPTKGHFKAHEALLSTQSGSPIFIEVDGKRQLNPSRWTYGKSEFYLKSEEEMIQAFEGLAPLEQITEWTQRTQEIADKCDVQIEYGRRLTPVFPVPEDEDFTKFCDKMRENLPEAKTQSDLYLGYLARNGFRALGYEDKKGDEGKVYRDRLLRELKIIWKYDFSDIILVVWDYIKWAHENDIWTGPRGSAAGSLVVQCLGISSSRCDPIKYDLAFERFINEDRVQPPDIDVDFETGGRDKVIVYLAQKYGKDKIASLGTTSLMKLAGCVRETSRALGLPFGQQNLIAKELAPFVAEEEELDLETSVEEVLNSSEMLRKLDKDFPDLFKIASDLQGLQKLVGRHAAGAVISNVPLLEIVPLMVRNNVVLTQCDMWDVEKLGLLKVDILGLLSLSVLHKAIKMIEKRSEEVGVRGLDGLLLDDIPLDDPEVFRAIREDNGLGLFQIQTRAMQGYVRRLPIKTIGDLAELIAAYRPSTARAGVTEDYVRAKSGQQKVDYYHPLLREDLQSTGGKMIFQEQVMKVFQHVAGYTLSQADNVRSIMGKMLGEEALAKHREDFYTEGTKKGFALETLNRLWHDLAKFSIYGFNKSHSVAYALITYWTAYIKKYYPAEFIAANMTCEADEHKFRMYVGDCEKKGIDVLGPDINESGVEFTVNAAGQLRVGLLKIQNVGQKSAVELVKKQPYSDRADFLSRIDRRVVNIRVIEFLIKAGAFDSISNGQSRFGQLVDMGRVREGVDKAHSNQVYEAEALGAFGLSHPVDRFRNILRHHGFRSIEDTLVGAVDKQQLGIAGVVTNLRPTVTKSGQEMAFTALSDRSGTVTAIIWPDQWAKVKEDVRKGACIAILGVVQKRGDEDIQIIADKVRGVG